MGCDGGTIPRRDELVRLKKKPEQADKHMERMAKWLHCAITQEELREPIVACELGRLYNKESVLEYLLDKSTCDSADHIRSLKDTRVLNLTENPAFKDCAMKVTKGDGYVDRQAAPFVCPVTGIEMNGLYKFCLLWTCGCVMSEKALKEVKSAVCHKCGVPYNSDEIILNGTKEDVDKLRDEMEDKRAKIKAEKKAKKAQKRKLGDATSSATSEGTKEDASSSAAADRLTNGETSGSKETNGSAAASSKTKKLTNGSASSSSKLPNRKAALVGKASNGKAANNGTVYTNQEFNPRSSEVYKSLFLRKDEKATDAHWVTYNPYYAMRK